MPHNNSDQSTAQITFTNTNPTFVKQAIFDLLMQIFADGKINLDDIPKFIALVKILLGKN